MRKTILTASALVCLLTSQAFAGPEIKSIPTSKAWGLVCNMVDQNGRGTTDYQVTSFALNKKLNFLVRFRDSLTEDNSAQVKVTKVRSIKGEDSNILTYSGRILNGARGNMFRNRQELMVTLDMDAQVEGRPNTFASKMTLGDGDEPQFPPWAAERSMQCTLVPQ